MARADTLRGYLRAAASLVTEAGFPDPLYSDTGNFPGSNPTLLPRFQQHFAEQKSWQAPKDAKNPLTPAMIWDMARMTRNAHPDSDSATIYDWMVLGLSTGARRVEYAQTSRTKIEMVWVQLDQKQPPSAQPYAFIDGDFTFLDNNGKQLHGKERELAAFVCIRWRTQKNKNNGETKLFALASDARMCPVGAARRIQARFERLLTPSSVLGISSEGYITASAITTALRACAARVHNVDLDDSTLKQYTPHSLRIGACVLLYEKGKSAVFIKDRLRWKSDTFMDYLRDTASVARQHAAALVRA